MFEVTSLASRAPHMVGSFLRKIIACGEAAGFEWAFFTATAPLKALLERLGLPLVPLADADRSRVANPRAGGPITSLRPAYMPSTATARGLHGRKPERRVPMVELLRVLRGSRYDRDALRCRTTMPLLLGAELVARVAGLAEEFSGLPQVIGLLGANGTDWAVPQLAAWTAGKTVVPLPTFFSRLQLEHVLRDAGIDHVIATEDAASAAAGLGSASTANLPAARR